MSQWQPVKDFRKKFKHVSGISVIAELRNLNSITYNNSGDIHIHYIVIYNTQNVEAQLIFYYFTFVYIKKVYINYKDKDTLLLLHLQSHTSDSC